MEYINPTGNKILVREIKEDEATESSTSKILIERSTAPKDILKGEVLGVGGAVEEVQVGDIIAYETKAGKEFTFDGVEHMIIPEGSVFGFKRDGLVTMKPIND